MPTRSPSRPPGIFCLVSVRLHVDPLDVGLVVELVEDRLWQVQAGQRADLRVDHADDGDGLDLAGSGAVELDVEGGDRRTVEFDAVRNDVALPTAAEAITARSAMLSMTATSSPACSASQTASSVS